MARKGCTNVNEISAVITFNGQSKHI